MVDALLQFAFDHEVLPYIPVDMWLWLKTQPSLPPVCQGRYYGTHLPIVRAVHGLKDIEILKSYLLMVWSEWDTLLNEGFDEMCTSICEDFREIGRGHH